MIPINKIGNASLKEFDFTFGQTTIKAAQYYVDPSEEEPLWVRAFRPVVPKGGTLWAAAITLCQYIEENNDLLKGKRALELGAGIGLGAIMASPLCKELLVTDGDTSIMALLNHNLVLNSRASLVRVCELYWSEENAKKFGKEFGSEFEVVFGSDLFYEEAHLEPLWETINVLLGSQPGSCFFLAQKERGGDLVNKCKQLAQDKYNFNSVEVKTIAPAPEEIHCLIFRRNGS